MLRSKSNNKRTNVLKNQYKEEMQKRNSRLDILCESWNSTRVGKGLDTIYAKNKDKARRIALAFENEKQHFKQLKESGIQIRSALGTTPENVLKIIKIGLAQSNRSEFLNEWQLETPEDKFWYIDTVYGSTKRGATEGNLMYEDMKSAMYGTEIDQLSLGNGDGTTTAFVGSFSPAPMIPYTIKLLVNGIIVGSDDGNGNFIGSTIVSSTSTVDYQTGAITINFVTAPANGVPVKIEGNWDSENQANFDEWGSVEIRLRSDRFHARPMPLTYSYSQFFAMTMDSNGLGNAEELLIKRVGDMHAIRKDIRGVEALRRASELNGTVETFNTDPTSAGNDNQYNHAQGLGVKIQSVSAKVYNELKRGSLNKAIMGTQAAAYLTYLKPFVPDDSQEKVAGSYYAGKLGTIDCYVIAEDERTIKTNQILLTYKNSSEDGDVSVACGTFRELSASLEYPEFYKKSSIATIEDTKIINPKFSRLLELQGL